MLKIWNLAKEWNLPLLVIFKMQILCTVQLTLISEKQRGGHLWREESDSFSPNPKKKVYDIDYPFARNVKWSLCRKENKKKKWKRNKSPLKSLNLSLSFFIVG